MRSCPKCGSYLPEGKILCPACWRPVAGAATSHRERTSHERSRTHTRITDAAKIVKRDTWASPRGNHPYAGNTYEQHKSHELGSKDYYKSKYDMSGSELPQQNQRIICAAAYFGFFFFLPLVTMPDSKEGRFHANQGLVLFIVNLIVSAIAQVVALYFGSIFEMLAAIPPLLMVYGAYNAFRGYMTELPVIGKIRLIKNDDNHFTNMGGRR